MLAPKPISPAKELRVKNSIPQLMKALPPVPGHDAELAEHEDSAEDCRADLPIVASPACVFLLPATSPTRNAEPIRTELESKLEDNETHTEDHPAISRRKLRLRTSMSSAACATGSTNPSPEKILSTPDITPSSSIRAEKGSLESSTRKPKLRLKAVVHDAPSTNLIASTGTVRRRVAVDGSCLITNLVNAPPEYLLKSQDSSAITQPRTPGSQKSDRPSRKKRGVAPSIPPVTPISMSTPSSDYPENRGSLDSHPGSTPLTSADGDNTSHRGSHQKTPLTLRHELQGFATNTTHLTSGIRKTPKPVPLAELIPDAVAVTPTRTSITTTGSAASGLGFEVPRRSKSGRAIRFRTRISKWVKGARTAVSAYVRRTRGTVSTKTRS
ncbi:uncharacterized protein E0L32_004374 [Thyridium curvatum]|uniref:Uncharacterized protein n=1 Tax=Thyridium curvatum TaxID=1093900 RepID=A0A507B9V9_9PEZI|nr:uncharacterized protein E0L32_004374 [Thyridium curvatum]TPX15394.1 hypothetical protein E0L32_004374 [Thyridium curvatum]